jgi:DNA-binding CsgD family transcriptional regulator
VLENVILAIGSADFDHVVFGMFERELRARQVALYKFGSTASPESLLAQDNRTDGCVHSLVHDYIGGYHRYDPFRAHYRPCDKRRVEVEVITVKEIADTEYAQHLYVEPGIAGKLCVILRRPRDALCLSLYRDRRHGSFGGDDMSSIHNIKDDLAAAVERHLSLRSRVSPTPVDDLASALREGPKGHLLSPRELAVCSRLLMGYSNEAIALHLALSFHSVRTYRRRAYLKLGVTSQNELFALVLGHGSAAPSER